MAPRNERARPVTKLCLALETHRRTDEGRVRDASAFLGHFFRVDASGAHDRLFSHMPSEVRADLFAAWGIRGRKSALRDDDERVRATVTDALAAGDIDAAIVEGGVTPEILVDWVPLDEWWAFWRGSMLPAAAVRKALAVARELALYDERWFLENLRGSAKATGTDVVCAALTKDQLVAWVRAVHASGDASPAGLITAVGWETVLAKVALDPLTHALDALARHVGLVKSAEPAASAKPIAVKPAAASLASTPPLASRSFPPGRAAAPPSVAASTPAQAEALPNARALFGAPPVDPPTPRAPATESLFDLDVAEADTAEYDLPADAAWLPPRAEPGDMGWDLVHGVRQPMPNNVRPRYEFGTDDEPTELPGSRRS